MCLTHAGRTPRPLLDPLPRHGHLAWLHCCSGGSTGLAPGESAAVAAGVTTRSPRGRMPVSSGWRCGGCPCASSPLARGAAGRIHLAPQSLPNVSLANTPPHAHPKPASAAETGPPRCLQATQPHRCRGAWPGGGLGTGKATQGCESRCSRRKAILTPHRTYRGPALRGARLPGPLTHHRHGSPWPR